jgi:hypothetical protein
MLNLYPPSTHQAWTSGVASSYPPGTDAAVNEIYEATKGAGTKEQALNKALGPKTAEQRGFIAKRYQEVHNQSLKSLLVSEASGHYEYLLKLIATPLPEAEAEILNHAVKGVGTKEKLIYPVVVGRTNAEVAILKKTYYDLYHEDLTATLESELSGDFKKVVLASLQASLIDYNTAVHTAAKAEADAEALYKAGEGKIGTDEDGFIKVLVQAPPQHLRAINAAYQKKHGKPLAEAAKKEFRGDAEDALMFLIRMSVEPLEVLSELFEEAMKGFGTDEDALSSAIVRYHIVLRDVKPAYKKKFGKELRDRIKSEVDGEFGELLLQVFDARD